MALIRAFLYISQYLLVVLGSQLKILIYLQRKINDSYKEAFKLENAFNNNNNNNNYNNNNNNDNKNNNINQTL